MGNILSPKVVTVEYDRTNIVPSLSTSSAAAVFGSPKGSTDVRLITSNQQFIEEYCVDNKVELNNAGHYSALAYLAKGNVLYCKRAVNGALYGYLKVKTAASSPDNAAASTGKSAPAFTSVSGEANLFYVFAKDPGAWNSKLKVSIVNVDAVNYTFDIVVYLTDADSVDQLVETWTVSRKQQLNGYGAQQYLEAAINGLSKYIVVKNDTTQADTVLPKVNATAIALGGGTVGITVTDSDIVNGWDSFTNIDEYDVRILINCGYDSVTVQTKMKSVAEGRKDCIAIFDMPYASITSAADMVTYRQTTQNFNSSYCTIYGPWLKINDPYNNQIVNVPPSGYIAGQMAFNDYIGEPWTAPAGTNRGVLDVLGLSFGSNTTKTAFTEGEMDVVFPAGINPIQRLYGQGIVIMGDKTQQTKASALDAINVRRSLIIIEKAVAIALRSFLFENNNFTTRLRVVGTIVEYMDRLGNRGAFSTTSDDPKGYACVCDESNNTPAVVDANELRVDLFVKPVRAIRYIKLNVIVTKTGTNISEVLTTNGII